jgi:DNA-binding GntR family transcriptional regulator
MPATPAALNRGRSLEGMRKAKRDAVPSASATRVPAIRSDRVRREIADQIISGALRPGQELDEKSLAQAFKVSRTPVREALRQLAAANLIEWLPHQSPVVAKITAASMLEMFEVMAELEGFCGQLAARRMTAAEQAALVAVHKRFRPHLKVGDREAYQVLNKSFHELIYAGSHNQYLRRQAGALYDRLAPYRAYQLKQRDAVRRAWEEHEAIIEAIIAGDSEEARRLLIAHVSLSNELFADLVAALSIIEASPASQRL